MSAPTIVILAAGEGTRMRSKTPKVLHPVCGRAMILWPVAAAQAAGAAKVVVVDGPARKLRDALPADVEVAVQDEPKGTGHAVQSAASHLDPDATVVILMGDTPLVTAETIAELVAVQEASGGAATVLTMVLQDPSGYGRVVRSADGSVERIVETKTPGDATPEQLAIQEVNTGIYAFAGGPLLDALSQLRPDNAQGELYLPDVLAHLQPVAAHPTSDPSVGLGINDRADLAAVTAAAQRRICVHHMRAGVTIIDPASTTIDADVTIGADTVIEPGVVLRNGTVVGEGVTIRAHSYLDAAQVDAGALVGPFAYLRPAAHLHPNAKAGTFVEIKNSEIGPGAKVPHLSYIGDADVGANSNIGAGTITANYDGFAKHRTTIGEDVRVSVDTALVAPVTLGDGAYTGAGSVITDDVPPGALGIARSRQTNVEGYAERESRTERE